MMVNKSKRESVVSELENRLQDIDQEYEIMAVAGSDTNDIDVFIILSDSSSEFVNKYTALVSEISNIERTYNKTSNLTISTFPTLELETVDKYLSESAEILQIHLLVYPNYECFVNWEDPMLVKTVTSSADVRIGSKQTFESIGKNIEIPPFTERISGKYILSLLINTYILLNLSQSDREMKVMDAAHKTNYVIRYMTFHRLIEANKNIKEIDSWEKISKQIESISEPTLQALFSRCYSWRGTDTVPDKKEIENTIMDSMSLLEEWYINGINND